MVYAQVIVPLPLEGSFTYIVPEDLHAQAQVGCRVIVPFGPKKIYTGVIATLTTEAKTEQYRELFDVLDDKPIINDWQLRFFQWISSYYVCTIGEVIKAALPAALKLSSESFISLNLEVDYQQEELSQREIHLVNALKENDLSVQDAGTYLGIKYPQKIIKRLNELGVIDLFERVKDKYSPKKVKKIQLNAAYLSEKSLEELLNKLEKRPKQLDAVMAYLREVPILENPQRNDKGILKTVISKDVSASSLKTLVKNGVFKEWEDIQSRLVYAPSDKKKEVVLSETQQDAFDEIQDSFTNHQTVLLHGITGSGKTEIYTQLIQQTLAEGRQVLLLLPEIALTTQIISRLAHIFGNTFGIYHSKYSDNERVEVWKNVLSGKYQFVVGVRSGIFLPFTNLGLIIVDEEHEYSYKQYDPAPRYHARDAAIYLANIHGAKTLLGTATPAIETYQNASSGKFGLVKLTKRYGNSTPPSFVFADVLKQRKQKKLTGNFTEELMLGIAEALEKKEQVIIFQNRRGYASYLECQDCATIPKCSNCAVSLTYHMYNNRLVCHYCGFSQSVLTDCTHCGSTNLKTIGFGTEELEEELNILFPQAIIQRMDLDTTRSKNGYSKIIQDFEQRKVDILVGTQMISKGLDFGNVNLVGIVDVDRIINFPDFRSHEKAFQMITQVSGRAGRKSQEGKVVVQTSTPDHPLLQLVRNGNYGAFYSQEILERQAFHYPPYYRLIRLTFKHRDKGVSFQASTVCQKELTRILGKDAVGGTTEPMIAKLRNQYLHTLLIKLEKGKVNLANAKANIKQVSHWLNQQQAYKQVRVVVDVDCF